MFMVKMESSVINSSLQCYSCVTSSPGHRQNTTDLLFPQKSTSEDIVFIVYYYGILIALSLVNIVGNSIVITGLIRHPRILVPGNYFIISLAISDICLGLSYPLYNVSHVNFVDVMDSSVGMFHFLV